MSLETRLRALTTRVTSEFNKVVRKDQTRNGVRTLVDPAQFYVPAVSAIGHFASLRTDIKVNAGVMISMDVKVDNFAVASQVGNASVYAYNTGASGTIYQPRWVMEGQRSYGFGIARDASNNLVFVWYGNFDYVRLSITRLEISYSGLGLTTNPGSWSFSVDAASPSDLTDMTAAVYARNAYNDTAPLVHGHAAGDINSGVLAAARLPAATQAAQGAVELATNAEVAAGTDAVRAITPAGLASVLSGMGSFLPGMMMDYAGATAPAGWLICDGSAVSRTTYAALFAVIGTGNGSGDGSTTFNLPDIGGRTTMGASAAHPLGWNDGLAVVNRSPYHAHVINAHSHSIAAHSHSVPSHSHSASASVGTGGGTIAFGGDGGGTTGSGGSHSHSTSTAGAHTHTTGAPNSVQNRATGNLGTGSNNHTHDVNSAGGHSHSTDTASAHTHSTPAHAHSANINHSHSASASVGTASATTTGTQDITSTTSATPNSDMVVVPYYIANKIIKT